MAASGLQTVNAAQPAAIGAPATAALIAQMHPQVLRYFRRKCGNFADAEDLTQDVLMRTLTRCTSRSSEEIKSYVFRAAVNGWRDRRRRSATRGIVIGWDDMAAYAVEEENTAERLVEGALELERLVAALKDLPPRTREVLLLIRLDHMKQADVADMFDVSVSAIEKHLARGLAQLSHALARDGTDER